METYIKLYIIKNFHNLDVAFYDRLVAETSILVYAVAHIIQLKSSMHKTISSPPEDAWAAYSKLTTKQIYTEIGIPLRVLKKFNKAYLTSPLFIETGELKSQQLSVLLEWCTQHGISYQWWL